jgi:hypothetical protein
MEAYAYNPRLKQEDCEFETSLSYIASLSPKKGRGKESGR